MLLLVFTTTILSGLVIHCSYNLRLVSHGLATSCFPSVCLLTLECPLIEDTDAVARHVYLFVVHTGGRHTHVPIPKPKQKQQLQGTAVLI